MPLDVPRFYAKVDAPSLDACWTWTASVDRKGYGKFGVAGKTRQTHRLAYEHLRGPIPQGLVLDHLCMNKRCCNPWHLDAVTQRENARRWSATVTECPKGHAYTEANTRIRRNGSRDCRKCDAEAHKANKAMQRRSMCRPGAFEPKGERACVAVFTETKEAA